MNNKLQVDIQQSCMDWGQSLAASGQLSKLRFMMCLTAIGYKYHVLMINCDFPNIPLNQYGLPEN